MTERRILLQVNATVIAGLLILLTIQATAEGGIPFLLDIRSLQNTVDMYDKAINDTSLDPILLEAMKQRQTEIKLEVMEKEAQLSDVPDLWVIELLFNPLATFTFAMLFFIASTIRELDLTDENASKLGRGLSYAGFMIMFIAVLFMIIMPAV